MKRIWKYLFLLISTSSVAQNLVPNPSFEIYDTCPDFLSQINRAVGWYATRPTPDYFNRCAIGITWCAVPSNYFGYRTPASGNAYAGVIAKYNGTKEIAETIGSPLITSLQIGIKYYVSLKVSLAGQSGLSNSCGISKLGALFSTIQYPNPQCTNCIQIVEDSVITDTLNWTRIKGSFIADSNYSYINIGRFDLIYDSIQIGGSGCAPYYYIDDVVVSEDSIYAYNYTYIGIKTAGSKKQPITYFPNPFTTYITVEYYEENIDQFKLYSITGILMKTYDVNHAQTHTFDLSNLPTGVYYLVANGRNLNPIGHILFKD